MPSLSTPSEKSLVDFAILAPVPEEHLLDGEPVADAEGFVAFGSRKWELFRAVDKLREGDPVPVLIYPSHEHEAGKLTFKIMWSGWYIGSVESHDGSHPAGMKHRPPSTEQYAQDNLGLWAVFWHVAGLKPLPEAEHRLISSLRSYKTGHWRVGQAPKGPEIVARPSWI
ncbi:MAG: hypothetical protein K8T91_10975 [Planctomycetes bacterium]|nr:hypothetical protein [Planctomycetota bacterium]